MKQVKTSIILLFAFSMMLQSHGQNQEIKRDWTSFVQKIKVDTDKKMKFKLVASMKAIDEDDHGKAQMWTRVDNKNGGYGFFENMDERPVTDDKWGRYTIEGDIDENSDYIVFGGLIYSNGKFYYDNFELFTENKKGEFELLTIENGSFEVIEESGTPKGWSTGIGGSNTNVKGFTISVNNDAAEGKHSLLVEGKGIEKDTTDLIGPIKGFSGQMGTLVTMLNNLSTRVESIVGGLTQDEVDHLHDDKANSIGALIMHLAATEVIYQAITFEDRNGFNEEEEKKWGAAMNLGQAGRDTFKGKSVKYYLEEWKKVRQKTIEGLQQRDDAWLAEVSASGDSNNHFYWFHVMEHQSSHLGQILFLRKRFPEFPKDIELQEKIKD